MKKLLIVLTIVVIMPIFSVKSSAEGEIDGFLSEFENILPDSLSGVTHESDKLLEKTSIKGLLSDVISIASGRGGEIGSFFLTLLGCVALTSLATLFRGELSSSVEAAVGLVASITLFPKIGGLISEVSASLGEINSFFSALTPITVGITALGGGEGTAAVQSSGMYLTLSLLGGVGGEVLSTLSAFALALALLSPLGGETLSSVSRSLKNFFSRAIGIFTALIAGIFSLQTIVAHSADSGAMRVAKYVASGLIPIVGTTVSGALSTLASGLSYAKGIVGGAAIVAILTFSLSPLVVLLCYRLCLSIALFIAEGAGSVCVAMISAYRSALDIILSVYASSVVIYLFEIIIFIRMGVAIL